MEESYLTQRKKRVCKSQGERLECVFLPSNYVHFIEAWLLFLKLIRSFTYSFEKMII